MNTIKDSTMDIFNKDSHQKDDSQMRTMLTTFPYKKSASSCNCGKYELEDLPQLRKILPEDYDYKLCDYIALENAGQFLVTLRMKLTCKDEALEWKSQFEKKSLTTLVLDKSFPKVGRVSVFKIQYRCQFFDRRKAKHKLQSPEKSKFRECHSILFINIKKFFKRTVDEHMPQFCTVVRLHFAHSHPLDTADVLKKRGLNPDIQQRFLEMYQHGIKPKDALDTHKKELLQKLGLEKYRQVVCDGYYVPNLSKAYRLYYQFHGKGVSAKTSTKRSSRHNPSADWIAFQTCPGIDMVTSDDTTSHIADGELNSDIGHAETSLDEDDANVNNFVERVTVSGKSEEVISTVAGSNETARETVRVSIFQPDIIGKPSQDKGSLASEYGPPASLFGITTQWSHPASLGSSLSASEPRVCTKSTIRNSNQHILKGLPHKQFCGGGQVLTFRSAETSSAYSNVTPHDPSHSNLPTLEVSLPECSQASAPDLATGHEASSLLYPNNRGTSSATGVPRTMTDSLLLGIPQPVSCQAYSSSSHNHHQRMIVFTASTCTCTTTTSPSGGIHHNNPMLQPPAPLAKCLQQPPFPPQQRQLSIHQQHSGFQDRISLSSHNMLGNIQHHQHPFHARYPMYGNTGPAGYMLVYNPPDLYGSCENFPSTCLSQTTATTSSCSASSSFLSTTKNPTDHHLHYHQDHHHHQIAQRNPQISEQHGQMGGVTSSQNLNTYGYFQPQVLVSSGSPSIPKDLCHLGTKTPEELHRPINTIVNQRPKSVTDNLHQKARPVVKRKIAKANLRPAKDLNIKLVTKRWIDKKPRVEAETQSLASELVFNILLKDKAEKLKVKLLSFLSGLESKMTSNPMLFVPALERFLQAGEATKDDSELAALLRDFSMTEASFLCQREERGRALACTRATQTQLSGRSMKRLLTSLPLGSHAGKARARPRGRARASSARTKVK